MAQIAAISNVNNFSANDCNFNMTVDHSKDPNDKLLKISKWLTAINFRTIQQDTFSKHTPETGVWLIESSEYKTWLSKDNGLLWAQGLPGAGKTILSSIIIHHLQEHFSSDPETAIVFAYCRYTDQRSVTDILASFVKQLAQEHHSVVLPIIEPIYDEHQKKQTRLYQQELQELLHILLNSFTKTYIIIDALDEVSDDTRADLLAVLSSLRACVLLTSRPLQLLEPLLPDANVCVDAENRKDIELFVDKRIEETLRLRVLLKGKGQHIREEIRAKLKQKSEGMFLLAALQIESLKHCTSVKNLCNAVDSLPSGLNALYECTWGRIEAQTQTEVSLATRAIIWLTYAYRSLGITELQHALAVSEVFDEDDVAEEELIVSVCCGLIVVDKQSGIVRLVHYTAYDFFRELSSGLFATPHTFITTTCLTYLSTFSLVNRELLLPDDVKNIFRSHPLLDYAYHHWGSHAKTCYGEAGLPPVVFAFLSQLNIYHHISDNDVDLLSPSHVAAFYGLADTLPVTNEWCNQVTSDRRCTPLILASSQGHTAIVERLVSQDDVNINSRNKDDQTALFAASLNGHMAIVKLLLSRNDVAINTITTTNSGRYDGSDGQTALSMACRNRHQDIVELLLYRKDVTIGTALVAASVDGHEGIVNLLLSRNDFDINSQDVDGQTALFAACSNGHEAIVKLLLSRDGAYVNVTAKPRSRFCYSHGQTALFAACSNGHEAIVKLLLSRDDVDVNIIATSKPYYWDSASVQTPLSTACRTGRVAIVKLLLSKKDITIKTGLVEASEGGHEDIVKLLLSRNDVDINSQDMDSRTALFAACGNGHEAVVKLLLSRDDIDFNITAKPRSIIYLSEGQTALFAACSNGHEAIVKLLLSRDEVDVNIIVTSGTHYRYDSFRTALSTACGNGHVAIVKLLLSRKDIAIGTALVEASEGGHEGIVALLLSRNDVDINLQDIDGKTALFAACCCGHEAIVKLLLSQADIAVNITTELTRLGSRAQAALFAAYTNQHEAIVKLLLSRDDVAVNNSINSDTLLSMACHKGDEAIVKLLLSRKDVTIDADALVEASTGGHEEIVKLFLSRNDFDINSQDQYGRTALFAACLEGHEAVVKLLLSLEDVRVGTALVAASRGGYEGIVDLLLSRNDVDINSQDYGHGSHGTALVTACLNGHHTTVKLLLSQNGIDINAEDSNGRTALWVASVYGHEAIVRLLLSRGDVTIKNAPLVAASGEGHEEIVKLLLCRDDVDINSRNHLGVTALEAACRGRHEAIVNLLLSLDGIDINSQDHHGRTALSTACHYGHEAIVKSLLSRKDVTIKTALVAASEGGHEGIVKLLLSRNDVDVNSQDMNGRTALLEASRIRHEGTIELLLSRNDIDIHLQDKDGQTALSEARWHSAIINLLSSRDDPKTGQGSASDQLTAKQYSSAR